MATEQHARQTTMPAIDDILGDPPSMSTRSSRTSSRESMMFPFPGAVLSVLQRLGRGLDLAPEGEKKSFRQQGFVRPWIAAVIVIASFVLLKGGLISIARPSGTANKILYYGGIAFLAGFGERFAQDMLVVPGAVRAAQRESTT